MKATHGLTLIEVLIALAIVSIAMTAIIKATGDHIRSTAYLKSKTTAFWVAEQVMTEIRLGVIAVPDDDGVSNTTDMLNQTWRWQANKTSTGNARIKKVTVEVSDQATHEAGSQTHVRLIAYV